MWPPSKCCNTALRARACRGRLCARKAAGRVSHRPRLRAGAEWPLAAALKPERLPMETVSFDALSQVPTKGRASGETEKTKASLAREPQANRPTALGERATVWAPQICLPPPPPIISSNYTTREPSSPLESVCRPVGPVGALWRRPARARVGATSAGSGRAKWAVLGLWACGQAVRLGLVAQQEHWTANRARQRQEGGKTAARRSWQETRSQRKGAERFQVQRAAKQTGHTLHLEQSGLGEARSLAAARSCELLVNRDCQQAARQTPGQGELEAACGSELVEASLSQRACHRSGRRLAGGQTGAWCSYVSTCA